MEKVGFRWRGGCRGDDFVECIFEKPILVSSNEEERIGILEFDLEVRSGLGVVEVQGLQQAIHCHGRDGLS